MSLLVGGEPERVAGHGQVAPSRGCAGLFTFADN
jgi:hypothetical protein